ncbi:TerB family tellurite resistance protein [Mucilaginibacter mali]|uniref:TerB family tellurite resistance protein n=1 Tax=Mucilaginibacter mali TaxID=2740462 RepID=A0A7D4QBM9_9SPHI|nr:TerB family tellurite resistance protein [Mucilaginibacter mali]QKJ32831.1 TerB family tellurite resistance protein [Mucilaginibacter mali]
MKKSILTSLLCVGLALSAPFSGRAQSVADVIQQLVLDYQKLASLKNILGQMYTGYTVLSKGYGAVKGVAQGNFSLQEAFLDGLYLVSPAVRKYPRVSDIINDQAQLVREYKSASGAFRQDQHFSPDELAYMMNIYNNLVSQSLKNLDDLSMVVTDSRLRMSDAERLTAIDRIYMESHNQLSYLRKFNDQAARISWQRAQGTADRQGIKSIYGLNE